MKLILFITKVTIYKIIYKNKETVYLKYLSLHNLGFLNKIHIVSSL